MAEYNRNAIFTKVKNAILTSYPSAYVTSVYDFAPPSFPCVFIRETGHRTPANVQTFKNGQDFWESTFQVQIFCNSNNPMSEAYGIYDVIFNAFKSLFYLDIEGATPIDNADSEIYRLTATFRRPIGGGEQMPN